MGDNERMPEGEPIVGIYMPEDEPERMPEGEWTGGYYMKEGDDETGLDH